METGWLPVLTAGPPSGSFALLFLTPSLPARASPSPLAAGADRLQSGMRGAFGKPYGKVARVHIGQVIMSVRSKEASRPHLVEALRRAKFKFPGRQKVVLSRKMGFTSLNKDQYEELKAAGKLKPDGCYVQTVPEHGPLGY